MMRKGGKRQEATKKQNRRARICCKDKKSGKSKCKERETLRYLGEELL